MKTKVRRALPALAAAGLALASAGPVAAATGAAATGAAATGAAATGAAATGAHGSAPRAARKAREVSPRQEPTFGGRLYSVAGTSPNDIWAVGLTSGPSLIVHWNGAYWAQYRTSDTDYLFGVSMASPRDGWAVGGNNWNGPTSTVAYRFNGRSWSRVPTPTPDGDAYFNSVAAPSATSAWAVGLTGSGGPGVSGYDVPIIEHWNGKSWQQQFFPLPTHSGQFNSVAAIGPGDAWAVGGTYRRAPNSALIEHWNGYRWRRVTTPPGVGYLQSVTMISRDDAWAVGFIAASSGPFKSLTMHWNGRHWYVVPSPNPTGDTNLIGVGASGPDDVWAVGYLNPTTCSPQCEEAIFHWNGSSWSALSSPNPGGLDVVESVLAFSRRNAWAVGTVNWSSSIIDHWNGKRWS